MTAAFRMASGYGQSESYQLARWVSTEKRAYVYEYRAASRVVGCSEVPPETGPQGQPLRMEPCPEERQIKNSFLSARHPRAITTTPYKPTCRYRSCALPRSRFRPTSE